MSDRTIDYREAAWSSEAERDYWDDDPNDPYPYPRGLNVSLDPDRPDVLDVARAEVATYLDTLVAWWWRRVERERTREHPHPDTERIVYNMTH